MKHYCRYCIHCIAQDETEAVCEELNIMIKKLPFGTLANCLIFAKLTLFTSAAAKIQKNVNTSRVYQKRSNATGK